MDGPLKSCDLIKVYLIAFADVAIPFSYCSHMACVGVGEFSSASANYRFSFDEKKTNPGIVVFIL